MLLQQQKKLIAIIEQAVQELLPDASVKIHLERPKVAAHGDMATNVAMLLARPARRNPRELAEALIQLIQDNPDSQDLLAACEVAGPGFINFRLTEQDHQAVVHQIHEAGPDFGQQPRQDKKVMVEFVSANPTGPLDVGHARQAALGDAICRLYSILGYEVSREFYYNDAGNQIHNLALSVQARARGIEPDSPQFPADGYRGDYILEIAQDFLAKKTVSNRTSTRLNSNHAATS